VYFIPENIKNPFFGVGVLQTCNCAVVFYAEKYFTAIGVGESGDFSCKL
jgi:hypothetical protein